MFIVFFTVKKNPEKHSIFSLLMWFPPLRVDEEVIVNFSAFDGFNFHSFEELKNI